MRRMQSTDIWHETDQPAVQKQEAKWRAWWVGRWVCYGKPFETLSNQAIVNDLPSNGAFRKINHLETNEKFQKVSVTWSNVMTEKSRSIPDNR